ncbi:LacI family DNA-binding transcriptional regulator [Streptomyces sp. NPDC101175]|uniref:LacI family DNA-binding transcriptional regulator n=1 Tax=Streptomyces sp. NPDC101175 TaxID=3366123 RepID=UPI0038375F65
MAQADVTRRATAVDVAREAGVSRATVGFVLNRTAGQTISESTRDRVLDAARRLGYRPNSAAVALRSGRSRLVLLVLPDWPMVTALRGYVEAAEAALEERGYCLVTHTRPAGGPGRPLWESLNPELVYGITPFGTDDIASMRRCGVLEIFPDPEDPESVDLSLAVSTGPRLQVEHLYERGCRTLAYVAHSAARPPFLVDARYRAAQERARTLGLPPLELVRVDHRDASADRAVRAWRDAGITGVVGFDDDVAAVVVGAAVRAGIQVPGDLAVIGHDDTLPAAVFVPSLSTVRIDTEALGRAFAGMIVQRLEGASRTPLDFPADSATVVARESTRR